MSNFLRFFFFISLSSKSTRVSLSCYTIACFIRMIKKNVCVCFQRRSDD